MHAPLVARTLASFRLLVRPHAARGRDLRVAPGEEGAEEDAGEAGWSRGVSSSRSQDAPSSGTTTLSALSTPPSGRGALGSRDAESPLLPAPSAEAGAELGIPLRLLPPPAAGAAAAAVLKTVGVAGAAQARAWELPRGVRWGARNYRVAGSRASRSGSGCECKWCACTRTRGRGIRDAGPRPRVLHLGGRALRVLASASVFSSAGARPLHAHIHQVAGPPPAPARQPGVRRALTLSCRAALCRRHRRRARAGGSGCARRGRP